jgi:hypothetical protein
MDCGFAGMTSVCNDVPFSPDALFPPPACGERIRGERSVG